MARLRLSTRSCCHWTPYGIHTQFRTGSARCCHRSVPNSPRGDVSVPAEAFFSTPPTSSETQDPSSSGPSAPTLFSLSADLPSLASSPSFARQGSRKRQHPFHCPHRACLVGAYGSVQLSNSSAALARRVAVGRDVTFRSSAVIQFSMSTRVSADSHSATRHPDR